MLKLKLMLTQPKTELELELGLSLAKDTLCGNIAQMLLYSSNIKQTISKLRANIIRILNKFCTNTIQILCNYSEDIVGKASKCIRMSVC